MSTHDHDVTTLAPDNNFWLQSPQMHVFVLKHHSIVYNDVIVLAQNANNAKVIGLANYSQHFNTSIS